MHYGVRTNVTENISSSDGQKKKLNFPVSTIQDNISFDLSSLAHTMFKPATPRLLPYPIHAIRAVRPRRTLFSSAPPSQRSRSWKSLAVRLGIAAGGVYYYSISNAFAEEPAGIY